MLRTRESQTRSGQQLAGEEQARQACHERSECQAAGGPGADRAKRGSARIGPNRRSSDVGRRPKELRRRPQEGARRATGQGKGRSSKQAQACAARPVTGRSSACRCCDASAEGGRRPTGRHAALQQRRQGRSKLERVVARPKAERPVRQGMA